MSREDQVFFLNATDPISLSGMGLGAHGDALPRRVPANYLVYHNDQLVLTLARRGRQLMFHTPDDHPALDRYLDVFHHLLYRSFEPERQIRIETINSEPAASSPYAQVFEQRFESFRDHKAVILQRSL